MSNCSQNLSYLPIYTIATKCLLGSQVEIIVGMDKGGSGCADDPGGPAGQPLLLRFRAFDTTVLELFAYEWGFFAFNMVQSDRNGM